MAIHVLGKLHSGQRILIHGAAGGVGSFAETQQTKWKSLACHKSQGIISDNGKYTPMMYDCGHPAMEDFRGKELGVHAAEAFIKMTPRGFGKLNF